ncbi:hypothetical protein [Dictyobacter formicarum]|uniref:DNA methylase N-4/N-6 domain-containing protein n=1 Tax=Dictyobacter formicarum TaxID=2778368 RepID=A0ABQ3V9K6_9CHLR|nr:hypothetical protein [Dictyobacter formicarum]GHO82470.1 hypothetical protein KSZ_04760 [Dictyobacter formicarum]
MVSIRPIHAFPARMAPEIALKELQKLPQHSIILDPMMGSGTVLRVALNCGLRAIRSRSTGRASAGLQNSLLCRPVHSPRTNETHDQQKKRAI